MIIKINLYSAVQVFFTVFFGFGELRLFYPLFRFLVKCEISCKT